MPQPLEESEVKSNIDPWVSKSWDHETPKAQQIDDFYKIVDNLKVGLLTTIRSGVGLVSRSMVVAKREGPDFLFLASNHSNKFSDLEKDKSVQITFQNNSSQDWVSISGTATSTSNSDPRIKEIYSKGTNAWLGDLGDGVHTGGPEDPRTALIEVKANFITYWKSTHSSLGFLMETTQASLTGQVAQTGLTREFLEHDIEMMRKEGL